MNHFARTRTARVVAASIASGLAVVALAGCGSSTDGDSTPTAPSSSTSASPSTSPSDDMMVGGDPATWSPVEVTAEMNGQTIDLVQGQAANFVQLPESKAGYFVVSSNDSAVTGRPAPDATTVPGFQAVGVGEATVVLYDGDPESADGAAAIIEVKVKVTEKTDDAMTGDDAGESTDDTDM